MKRPDGRRAVSDRAAADGAVSQEAGMPSLVVLVPLAIIVGAEPQHSPEHLQFVKDAVALRKSAVEYLVHGRVMRPPTMLGPPLPTVTWYTSAVVPHTYNAYPPCAVPVVVANSFKADNGSFALILANHGLKDVHYHARIKLDEDYDNSNRDDEPPPRQATVSLTIKAMEVLAVPLEPDSDGAM